MSNNFYNDDFLEAVEHYLTPQRHQFNYEALVQALINNWRFHPWVVQLKEYRALEGAVVLSPGCGSAGDLLAFMEWGAAQVYGLEVDAPLCHLATLRFRDSPYKDACHFQTYENVSRIV